DEPRRRAKRNVSWRWVAIGVPALVVPPLGLWFLLRKGIGLPWTWILGPSGLVAGLLLMAMGSSSETLFPFALGISLLPLCLAALARRFGAPSRPTWTAVGVLLLAYWLLPEKQHNDIFGNFESDIEMFVISGIMISVASTLVIVFNARWLLALFSGAGQGARAYLTPAALAVVAVATAAAGVQLGDSGEGLGQLAYLVGGLAAAAAVVSFAAARFPQLGPSLKMAIAYPLANRFRTGMTIMMFSIIVFSLTIFSVLLANFGSLLSGDKARGNLDIVATSPRVTGVTGITEALAETGSKAGETVVASGRTTLPAGSQQVRQPGDESWEEYPVVAADDAFLGTVKPSIESFATGYADGAAVLAAVRSGSGFALMDSGPFTDFSDYDWWPSGVKITDNRFTPFQVEARNADTGQVRTVTIIGILATKLPSATVGGIYLNDDDYRATFGAPVYQRHYLRLQPGTDAKTVARAIESALALRGVEADSVKQVLDDTAGTQVAFNRMFQAFMALGLIVGIAGLGVISFRSVVERRQQIGMLRAIGFQRGAVTTTFLLESGFIAAMGILAGVVFGAIVARNLLTSDSFTDGAAITFAIPWAELCVVIGASMVFALLMTWWPSRGASRVPVADALRYE
ncbi:MAG: ABC transporter permease, partial [Dehalococcoidia bacterium]